MIGYLFFLLFAATIPLANFLIGHVGTVCVPSGPCLIPVGFGLMAPSGVLMVGVGLVLRDMVQRTLGWKWGVAAIGVGAVASWFLADPAIVVASTAAFVLSELSDFAIYTPLAKRRLWLAVAVSGVVGAAVDSALFLWLAFGSLDLVAGQMLGKVWMVLAATLVLVAIRKCWFGHAWRATPTDLSHIWTEECNRCGKKRSGWTFS